MNCTLDQALAEATPDRFGARWAIADCYGHSYVVTDLDGQRTYARQRKRGAYIQGKILNGVPSGLLWRPMSLTRAEPR